MPNDRRSTQKQIAAAIAAEPNRSSSVLALLFVVTLLAYLPALRGQMLWDDNAHVTKPELQSLGGLYRIWFDLGATQQYYPLLHTAFWLEHALWGDHVLGYHLVNVLQHAANACLVFFILQKLKIPGALLAAAIFALHPVQVESVAWITEQKNTLSGLFYLSAMFAYLQFDATRERKFHALALGLFVLGLLTKTVTATLPAALLVIFWWQRGKLSWRRDVQPLAAFFVLGLAAGVLTAVVERKLIGAEGAAFELTLLQRGLLAGRVVWFYLAKLLWPADLMFIYPRWQPDATVWWQWLYPLATLAGLAVLWAIRGRWRGPLAGVLFFVGTLMPVMGFLNVYPFIYSFVADHFQYLACLGVIVLAASAIALVLSRMPPGLRPIGNVACLTLVGTLGLLTALQCRMYANPVTLFRTTIARNPDCWMAHNNLGVEYLKAGRTEDATRAYEEALRIKPDYAEAHSNLGNQLSYAGKAAEAVEHFEQALKYRPGFTQAEINLGNALVVLGRPQEAIEHFQHVLQLDPSDGLAEYDLGNTLRAQGDLPHAIEHFQRAVERRPDLVEARYNLAIAMMATDRLPEAIEQLRATIRLRPELAEAHQNLGVLLARTEQLQEAVDEFQEALRLDPENPDAYANLTKAYARLGQSANAIATAEKAAQIARAKQATEMAAQIEEWIANYRAEQAQQAGPADAAPSPPADPSR